MATLWRIFSRGRPCVQALLARHGNKYAIYRHISTSEKKDDLGAISTLTDAQKTQELKELEEHFADADPDKLKNWVSFGWSVVDREEDEFMHNFTMFLMFTVMLVGGFFTIWSLPDMKQFDWAIREAYFDMEKREKAGLPFIDPYSVPPEQVTLPPDDEIEIEVHL